MTCTVKTESRHQEHLGGTEEAKAIKNVKIHPLTVISSTDTIKDAFGEVFSAVLLGCVSATPSPLSR